MHLTVYEKELIGAIKELWPKMDTAQLVEQLIRIGVIDRTRCKILIVREFVEKQVSRGSGKLEAMYIASDKFCCSYEYVRKCMYYYKGINLP